MTNFLFPTGPMRKADSSISMHAKAEPAPNVTASYKDVLSSAMQESAEPSKKVLKGDINNDGKVNIGDLVALKLHLLNDRDAANVYNEDVDGNGTVDENDVKSLSNLMLYGKIQVPTDIAGDINNDGRVSIGDLAKLAGYLNHEVDASAVYNEDVDGNGTVDENDVQSIENLILFGTITKPEPAPVPPDPVPVPEPTPEPDPVPQPDYSQKIGWIARAYQTTDVYTDAGLTEKAATRECIYAGEDTTILEETDKSYRVQYWSDTIHGYKERWVDKAAVSVSPPTEEPDVDPALQNLIQEWSGRTWVDGTAQPFGISAKQCKEFASYIFYQMYGIRMGSTMGNKYQNNTPASVACVGSVTGLTAEKARQLFQNARSGDYVQMRRGTGTPHSAIVEKVTSTGVWFFEANADGRNSIWEKFYSFEDLVRYRKGRPYNTAMSVYRAS